MVSRLFLDLGPALGQLCALLDGQAEEVDEAGSIGLVIVLIHAEGGSLLVIQGVRRGDAGSSIMPQKKNPDVTELIRGKTGRVYGDLNTLLVMMKGIPLAYNKDMQEDKEAIFDAVDTLELCLKTVTPMLDTMKTLPANMRRAAAKGFINATDCADYLTKKGMPFRDAYKLTGCMVSDCISKDKTLEELTLDEFKGYSALFENDIYDAIDLIKCCEGRTSYGGPSEASVKKQIELASAQLGAWEAANA